MKNNHSEQSRSEALAGKVIHAALTLLKLNGGSLRVREVIKKIGQTVELDAWATEQYENSGRVRWKSILHFQSITAVKAGILIKKKGVWYLTPEGEKAIKKDPQDLPRFLKERYKEWRKDQPPHKNGDIEKEVDESSNGDDNTIPFDQIEQTAIDGIKEHISKMNPYEFQDLVAALFRGMGYYTPFIAPKGKDGGIDIVAYSDPFGTKSPRIKVQVKHREKPSSVKTVRELVGVLHKDGDAGIVVSSGGFTPDAKAMAANSSVHVELIDMDAFIVLWQEFFKKLTDEDKNLLPLVPVYFLAPE